MSQTAFAQSRPASAASVSMSRRPTKAVAATSIEEIADQPPADNPAIDLRNRFKASMQMVASTVALVAAEHDGQRGGLTATATCSFSVDPPLILACVNRRSHTHRLIRQAGIFSINYLAAEHEPLAELFSRQFDDPDTKFGIGAWGRGKVGAPILLRALATVECTVHRQHDEGTHSIFLGKVVDVTNGAESVPLLYARHRFARLAE